MQPGDLATKPDGTIVYRLERRPSVEEVRDVFGDWVTQQGRGSNDYWIAGFVFWSGVGPKLDTKSGPYILVEADIVVFDALSLGLFIDRVKQFADVCKNEWATGLPMAGAPARPRPGRAQSPRRQ